MKFGLKQSTIDLINSVFKKYPAVEKVIIYGSRAMGNYKNGSDIDLTFIANTITDRDWRDISFDLDDLLTPYSFDLSILSKIDNPDLVDHIKRRGQVFYQKSENKS